MKKPELLDLRPTQFVLGMKEVEAKIKKIRAFSKKEWADYRADHVVPVVRGPEKQVYLIDHHHFIRACWECDTEDFEIELLKDFSDLDEKAFWKEMVQRGWTYLHDQFGNGPHPPESLPVDIRCLGDDPYRSLVWALIDHGAIEKTKIPFFEFQWAEFFRKSLRCTLRSKSDLKEAMDHAVELAAKAPHLPGFRAKA